MVELLVVEPDEAYASALMAGLNSVGFATSRATDAQEAVDHLDRQAEIRLVITELQLPRHNGLALLQHLQSYADWQQLPVVVLSQFKKVQIELAPTDWRQYGVVEYIYKPKLEFTRLIRQIAELAHATPAH